MNIPTRIVASRQHPEPAGTKRVCRPSKFGNNNKIIKVAKDFYIINFPENNGTAEWLSIAAAHQRAVEFYAIDMIDLLYENPAYYDELFEYKHLACFCPLELPCHVDAIIVHLTRRAVVVEAGA